jgi:sugar (pentulose or hexulose) kinase
MEKNAAMTDLADQIENGRTFLGIEFGSTRIKAVLIDESCTPLAEGSHTWENRYENGIWTYSISDIWQGLSLCYSSLKRNVSEKYGIVLRNVSAAGVSAMMHGYMAFDKNGSLLVPFRTWRNTITEEASEKLTRTFSFHIPQRWSIAHLYQAILNGEEHVADISYQTTLAGYVHWKLTGEKVLGIGEASGMFPIDTYNMEFNAEMLDKFDSLANRENIKWKIRDILPKVLMAGDMAGTLTEEGARLLDKDGDLKPGIPFCPPEGDAGTGMVATDSIKKRTGNVSAGTSVFAMAVLEKPLMSFHPEIDMVTTPDGHPVAMVHCNNCTSDLNAWVDMFATMLESCGMKAEKSTLYSAIFDSALKAEGKCTDIISYNYFSGEHITGLTSGRPLLVRKPDAEFDFNNFSRAILFSALATLKAGMDILTKDEKVRIDRLSGHGGWFKSKGSAARIMAAAMNAPVSVLETAGEGGPWGMAILSSYMINGKDKMPLDDYLEKSVFSGMKATAVNPDMKDVRAFEEYKDAFLNAIEVEKIAAEKIV